MGSLVTIISRNYFSARPSVATNFQQVGSGTRQLYSGQAVYCQQLRWRNVQKEFRSFLKTHAFKTHRGLVL